MSPCLPPTCLATLRVIRALRGVPADAALAGSVPACVRGLRRAWMSFHAGIGETSLHVPVGAAVHVLQGSDRFEVLGAAAGAITAQVVNLVSLRDRADPVLVREPVCHGSTLVEFPVTHPPVAVVVAVVSPVPASRRRVYLELVHKAVELTVVHVGYLRRAVRMSGYTTARPTWQHA